MGNSDQMPLVLSILAVILAVIAIIIGSVSISRSNDNVSGSADGTTSNQTQPEGVINPDDDKVWIVSIGHDSSRWEYLDEVSGTIQGFDVDIVNAVCQIANKNCRFSADVYQRCWDSSPGQSPQGGEGLYSGYYDACTAWSQTYVRARSFQFSNAFAKSKLGGFFTKTDNPDDFDWTDIRGKTIGFIDGFAFDEFCVARVNTITGADIPTEMLAHYPSRDDLINAVINGDVDAAFDSIEAYKNTDGLGITIVNIDDPIDTCVIGGFSMMMRKDVDMWKWFNPALESLMATTTYRTICKELIDTHGHIAGPNPEDICIGYS